MAARAKETDPDFLRVVGSNLRPSFAFANEEEVKSIFPLAWPAYLEKMKAPVPQLESEPDSKTSREIMTLSSLTWNGGVGLLGTKLPTALSQGNRAEAWYEIRYGSNKRYDRGLQKRRFFEAEVFGLYDDPGKVTAAEATNVLQMLSEKRVKIMEYEHALGQPPDGKPIPKANLIRGMSPLNAANVDFKDLIKAGFSPTIKTLNEELAPAATAYVANLNQRYAGINLIGKILQTDAWSPVRNPSNIYVAWDAGASLNVSPNETGTFASGTASLLVGQMGRDTLVGGKGSDLMFGGDGDVLRAGTGNETLVADGGAETFEGNANATVNYEVLTRNGGVVHVKQTKARDALFIDNLQAGITFGSKTVAVAGKAMTWTDAADPAMTYRFVPGAAKGGVGTLTISGGRAGNAQIVIDDFDLGQAQQAGYLGIHLTDRPQVKLGQSVDGTTVKGTLAPLDISFATTVDYARTVELDLSGIDLDKLRLNTGADNLQVTDGKVTITVGAGEAGVTLGLVYLDPAASATAQLRVGLVGDEGDAADASTLSVAFDRSDTPAAPDFSHNQGLAPEQMTVDRNGVPVTIDAYKGGDGSYSVDGRGGPISVKLGNGNNIVAAGAADDAIVVGNGDNRLALGGGNDIFWAANGDNVVEAQGSTAIGYLGYGHNRFYGNGEVGLAAALDAAETGTPRSRKGNLVTFGGGQATVVAGAGNDLYLLGDADAVVVLGAGNSTVAGGVVGSQLVDTWNTRLRRDQDGYHIDYLDMNVTSTSTTPVQDGYDGNTMQGLAVGGGNTTIFGGSGNNVIMAGNGLNYIDAGSGNSSIWGGSKGDTIFGGTGDVLIDGMGGDDVIHVESGKDLVYGGSGNNSIYGGSGNATIYAGSSPDRASADGDNYVEAGSGDTIVYGSSGNDTLMGGSGHATLVAGDGNATIVGGTGSTVIQGGAGHDVIWAGDGGTTDMPTTILAGTGDTTIYGGRGVDVIQGGAGTTLIYTGDGGTPDARTTVVGGSGDTTIHVGSGFASVQGGSGQTVIFGGDGGSAAAPDVLVAGSGPTTIYGGTGVAQIHGGSGDSVLYAGDGGTYDAPTVLYGGVGRTTLVGGSGVSQLIAGTGPDTFELDGSGTTTIFGAKQDDVIRFGPGITLDDVTLTPTLYDDGSTALVIDAGGSATLVGGIGDGVDAFQFDDGTVLSRTQLMHGGQMGTLDLAGNGHELLVSNVDGEDLRGTDTTYTAFAYGDGSVVHAASGSSTLVGGGADITYAVETLESHTVVRSSAADDVLQLTVANADDVQLVPGRGFQELRFGASGSVRVEGTPAQTLQTVQFADGTRTTMTDLATRNGVRFDNADGSYGLMRHDSQGNVTVAFYSSTGVKQSRTWSRADGSSGSDTYRIDGSSTGTVRQSDGSTATYEDDGRGMVTTQLRDVRGAFTGSTVATTGPQGRAVTTYDANGAKLSTTWTRADGSHGTDVFAADGSASGTAVGADGTQVAYSDDGKGLRTERHLDPAGALTSTVVTRTDAAGNVTTTNADAAGATVSDTWRHPDGAHGGDFFNADGSSSGYTYAPDGSYTTYVDDGKGTTSTTAFNAAGVAIGVTTTTPADSGGVRTDNPDGTYVVRTGSGSNLTWTTYSAAGVKLSDSWSRADGSSGGDVFQAGGVVTGRTYRPDGSYAIRSSDGSGVSTETFYDVNGNKTGGTYTLTNAGVQSITEQFDANGRLIGETWRHADGRTGSDPAGARDMFGLQFGATMVTFGTAGTVMNGVTIRIPQDTPTARMGAEAEMFITVNGVAGTSYSIRGFNPIGSPTRTTLEMYDALTGIVFTGTDTTTAGTSWRFSQKGKESLYLDGFGNGVMTGYASDGHRVSDMWFHNDGSAGYTFYGADGSWHGQVVDVHGVVTTVDSGGVVGQEGPTSVGDPTGTGVAPDAPTPSAPAQLGAAATAPVTHDDRSAVVGVGYVEPTRTFSRVDGQTVESVVTPLGSAVVSVNGVVAATVDTDPGYSLQRSIDGKTYRWNYDPAGILLARTVDDGNGVTTTETLDAAGRLTGSSLTIAMADGSVRTVQYDAADRAVGSSTTTVAGTVTTTLLYDAAGAAIGSRVTTSDGAGSSGTIVYDAAGNVSASSRVEVLAPGTVRITQFDASGAQTGAYMMAVDAAGNITTSNYDAAGRLTGSVAAMPNTDGAYRTGNYDAAGKLTSSTVLGFDGDSTVLSVYDAHGTLLRSSAVGPDAVLTSSDNAGATVQYRPDGSSDVTHDDGRGNREVISYSSGHVMTARAWQQSDGSHGTDRYEPDGRVTGDAVATDGSRSTFVTDTAGTRTTTRWSDVGAVLGTTVTAIVDGASRTTFYGADGAPQSARWSEADGTTVNVIYVADGGRTETRQIADGTSSVMTDDAKGNVETLFYDAAKHKTKRIWKLADGAYGNDLFDAFGASVGHAVNADGSTVDSTDDAHGNTSWIKKSAAGVEIERGWHYADGTQKTLWSPGDSMTHVKEQAADGTYVIRVFDNLGNLFVTNYDAAGNETTESWQTPDGAHGSGERDSDGVLRTYAWDATGRQTRFAMTRPDGSSYVTLFHSDGGSDSTDTTVPDAHGIVTATSTYFGPGGTYLGHATGLSDGHGNSTLQRWDASDVLIEQRWTRSDGTSGSGDGLVDEAQVTDADGRHLVRRINVFGVVTSDTWTADDGSHGSDTFGDDGTTEGTAIRADGGHRDYVNRANGEARWTDYDAAGHALAGYQKYANGQFSGYTNTYTGDFLSGDTWYQSDGSYGSDRYEPDGSSSGSNYSASDATTYSYTINTDNVAFYNYTAPDGRHGTSSWYPDGSNSSTDYAVDQTYTTTVNDAAGNSVVTYYDQYGYKLRDTWTHADGSTGSDVFEPNRAPVAVVELTPQRAQEASPFSYVLPTALFSDPDEGEVLGYSIRGADGTAPPDWLHFDPATMTLSGTPAAGSAGALQLQVVATDRGGLTGVAPIELDIDSAGTATAHQSDGSARVATAAIIESVMPDGQVVPTFDAVRFAQAYAAAQAGETIANHWAIADTLLAAHLGGPAMGVVEMAYLDVQRTQMDGVAVAAGGGPTDASAGVAGPNGLIWSGVRQTPGALA
ncbi:hypothetical protein HAV22_01945 [Massilia sp. TW-1]|uniref:Dystroglycan-type cadherin-like domain-containing protein n=1 Tax=Telluria antibiotica TaxID=2717319 RepID=A0ABX0P5A8_9BURK|nr:putative Ig domain-containing protein [Telluria antibiotica]NIA52416.1 hypothetical protein [Telluria antibiotica]